jgi:hypothetical protein
MRHDDTSSRVTYDVCRLLAGFLLGASLVNCATTETRSDGSTNPAAAPAAELAVQATPTAYYK